VPLIIEERHSKACRQLLRTDPTGACIAIFGKRRRDREFVVLAEAARQEGFKVVVPRAR